MQQYSWWRDGVVYQIYPRSFNDSNGDGIGDLQGIIDRLDYLNDGTPDSLGVDAIWISPIYPSPMADFGYDVANYVDIDPMFGDLATFDRLLAAAHQRNMRVVIDFVPNHTSDQHPWFLESRSSRDNPKADWYIWRDAKPDGSLPNNWGGVFGGTAWEWVEARQQYYFHQFAIEQPDLNWRNPDVRAAMFDVLRFWLDRGVDGFRLDVIHAIMKHPDMPDQPDDPQAVDVPDNFPFGRQQHIYDFDQDEVHPILFDLRKVLDEYDDRCAIGELFTSIDRFARYYGANGEELHLPFNFYLMDLPWKASAFAASVDAMEAALPPFAQPNYVLGNHDNARLATRKGRDQARVAAMLLLTLRGTPTLYNGDEIGMVNGVIEPHQVVDPQGINLGVERTRDVARTPMQWDARDHAGFSTITPWLPVHPEYATHNVEEQNANPHSMLNLYRRLMWLRKSSPDLLRGAYRRITDAPEDTFIYHRGASTLVALNFSDRPQRVNLPGAGDLVLSTYLDNEGARYDGSVELRPNEGMILRVG